MCAFKYVKEVDAKSLQSVDCVMLLRAIAQQAT